jgi:hypothetical protein
MDEETEAMAAAVRGKIPNLKQAALGSEYSYHSLPLCVIVLYRSQIPECSKCCRIVVYFSTACLAKV